MGKSIPGFCLLLLFVQGINAQFYSGTVVDSLSGQPISYATVEYAPQKGVITNEEGFFQFQSETEVQYLLISCLGYHPRSVPKTGLRPENNLIKLQEAVVRLEEVFVSNEVPNAESIIARVRAHLAGNYPQLPASHRVFSRETEYVDFEEMDFRMDKASGFSKQELARTNAQLDSLAKAVRENRTVHFKDYLGNLYYKNEGEVKLKVEKATSLQDTKNNHTIENIQEKARGIVLQYMDTSMSYKIKSGIFKIEDSLTLQEDFMEEKPVNEFGTASLRSGSADLMNTAFFYEESFLQELLSPGAYHFSFLNATFMNDDLIYVIGFQPRKGRSKFSGKLYINGDDYAIVRANYSYAEGKRGNKVNLRLLLGIKYLEDTEYGTILYKKGENGYLPSYIQRTNGSYFYVNRPFKLVENSSERDKLKFNFVVAGHQRNREELLITASEAMEDSFFNQVAEPEKVQVKEIGRYDPSLWQEEETLQPLEEMRQFNALP